MGENACCSPEHGESVIQTEVSALLLKMLLHRPGLAALRLDPKLSSDFLSMKKLTVDCAAGGQGFLVA